MFLNKFMYNNINRNVINGDVRIYNINKLVLNVTKIINNSISNAIGNSDFKCKRWFFFNIRSNLVLIKETKETMNIMEKVLVNEQLITLLGFIVYYIVNIMDSMLVKVKKIRVFIDKVVDNINKFLC